MKTNRTMLYAGMILFVALIWGVSNPLMKIGYSVITPLLCQAVRFILAFLIFAVFCGKKVFPAINRKHIIPYLIISAFTAGAFLLGALSLMYTTATISGFLMSTVVIFTPFVSYLILKLKVEKRHILPIVIVTAGLYLLCGGGSGGFDFGTGELFALLCAISGAGMLVFSSKYLQEIDPLSVSVMQTGFTGIYCVIFLLIFEGVPNLAEIPPAGWGLVLFLAVGCTCVAYLFQNIALSHISATYAALIFCSEPIFTAIASYFMIGEQLTVTGLIGTVLIMVSIVMASLSPEKAPGSIKKQEDQTEQEMPVTIEEKEKQPEQ